MVKQWLLKRAKMVYGFLNTYMRKKGQNYDDAEWWDAYFYTEGVSDRQTISQKKSIITAKYHYASMELQILKYLRNNNISVHHSKVLDIGSGSGHWIDFYKSLEAGTITGIDVSLSSFNYLKRKYSGDSSIEIHHGKALEIINKLSDNYDLVNAIGVMFHIVDDSEWRNTINVIGKKMKNGGVLIVGDHFGFMNGLNVQIDKDGNINKRVRSRKHWTYELRKAGFTNIKVYRNNAYFLIRDTLPENNVLIATK